MTHANYLRRQADTLVHLSRATIDLTIAGRLRALAAEFTAKAAELEDELDRFTPLRMQTEVAAVDPSAGRR